MTRILAIGSITLLAAYSYDASSANPALIAFLDRANVSLERCDAAVLERTQTVERRSDVARRCADDARRQMEPFYDAAAAAVRMQRGTSMYLTMYHTQWTQHMQRLSDTEPAPTDSTRQMVAHDIEQLRMLEKKLIQ